MSKVLLDSEHSLSQGSTRAIDLSIGGQQGALKDPANWVSNANYVKPRMIPVLLQAPGAMKYLPDGESRIKMLKALVELHATSITGIDSSLTVEMAETALSNAGEMMESVTKVSRARSVPVFSYPEKFGKPIYIFFRDWIVDLLQDPDTGHPGIIRYEAYQNAEYPELLADMISMAVLFIEANENLTSINDAWLCTNMMPKGIVNTASRVIGEALETVQHEVEFSAVTQVGDSVNELALDYINSLNKSGYAPRALQRHIEKISPDVADDATPVGYRPGVKAVADAIS